MITLGINLLIVSVLLLIVGLIKPKWILFYMDKPSRLGILMLSSVVFMGGAICFGEGTRQKKEALANQQQKDKKTHSGNQSPIATDDEKE